MNIRINSYIPITNVEGPETRFAIWVQGCPIRCKGCANSQMWDENGGTLYEIKDFVEIIKLYKYKIKGITFLGGEPLAQMEAVIEISKKVQELGLSVLVFTGYEFQKLKNNVHFQELTKHIDILVDGKFEEDKLDYSRPWVGSSNQNYYFFSDRYDEKIITQYKNKIEIRTNKNGEFVMSGMGDFKELTELMR